MRNKTTLFERPHISVEQIKCDLKLPLSGIRPENAKYFEPVSAPRNNKKKRSSSQFVPDKTKIVWDPLIQKKTISEELIFWFLVTGAV